MSKRYEHKVTVTGIKRANSSANGNPAFVLITEQGEFRTQTDSMAGYSVENDFNSRTLPREATLITTAAQRVFDWKLEA